MSILKYGDGTCGQEIVLDYILTEDFSEEPILNGPDYLYTKQTVQVRAVLNKDVLPGGSSAAQIKKDIESFLWCPRKRLIYQVNGNELIHSPKSGNVADEKYGPIPEHCKLTIMGDQTFYLEYRVSTWVKKCNDGSMFPQENPVLSHRFSEESTIDDQFRTVKKRSGKVIFTTSLKKLVNPDAYRWLVICPTIKGCIRSNMKFAVNSDYNELAYEVTDTEVNQIPPRPAVDMKGFHEVTTNKGAVHYQTVSVTLTGAKGTPKKKLIDAASAVVFSRLSNGIKGKWFVDTATVTDMFEDNIITMKVRAMVRADDKNKKGVNALFNNPYLDRVFGSPKSQEALDPGTRGTADIGLVGPDLVDLCCCPGLGVVIGNIMGKDEDAKQAAVAPPVIVELPVLPDSSVDIKTSELQDKVYSDYKIDMNYETNDWKLQLPVASSKAAACSFPQVAAPTMKLIVDVECEAIGAKPHLPDPDNVSDNLVLLDKKEKFAAPELTTDNNEVFHCTLRYEFGVKNPAKQDLGAGILPWVNMQWSDVVYSGADFIQGLISN